MSTIKKDYRISNIFNTNSQTATNFENNKIKPQIKTFQKKDEMGDIIGWTGKPEIKKNKIEPKITKSSIVLGTDDTSKEYNKKFEPKINHDPNKYFNNQSSFQRKMLSFYSANQKSKKELLLKRLKDNKIKTTFGTLENEFNSQQPKTYCLTTRGENNRKHVLNEIMEKNSVKNPKKIDHRNTFISSSIKANSLLSNIFNDPAKEEFINKIPETKPKIAENRSLPKKQNYFKPNKTYAPVTKLDWSDPKNNLYYRPKPSDTYNANQRKMMDLYGTTKCNHSVDMETMRRNKDPRREDTTAKLLGNTISYDDKPKKANKMKEEKYEIKNFGTNENLEDFKRAFANKGLHIYDIKTEFNTVNPKMTFSLRSDSCLEYQKKFEDVKALLKKTKGYKIENFTEKKRRVP